MKKPATIKKTTPAAPAAKTEVKKATVDVASSKTEKVKPKAAKKTATKESSIDKACQLALDTLRELNLDEGLQSEMQWCLGSYQNDLNPSGLYLMAKRAHATFTAELANKTKGITTKLITDLEKAIGKN